MSSINGNMSFKQAHNTLKAAGLTPWRDSGLAWNVWLKRELDMLAKGECLGAPVTGFADGMPTVVETDNPETILMAKQFVAGTEEFLLDKALAFQKVIGWNYVDLTVKEEDKLIRQLEKHLSIWEGWYTPLGAVRTIIVSITNKERKGMKEFGILIKLVTEERIKKQRKSSANKASRKKGGVSKVEKVFTKAQVTPADIADIKTRMNKAHKKFLDKLPKSTVRHELHKTNKVKSSNQYKRGGKVSEEEVEKVMAISGGRLTYQGALSVVLSNRKAQKRS